MIIADPPPRKKPAKLKPRPPKFGKKGPKSFIPSKDEMERKTKRMMEKLNKKGTPPKVARGKPPGGKWPPAPPTGKGAPGFDKRKGAKGKVDQGKGAPRFDKKGKPFGGFGKNKGKPARQKNKNKAPRGWNKPPKLPVERFGPCQACYAVVSNLGLQLKTWSDEAKEALEFDTYCPSVVMNYSLVTSPHGRGMPIIQGPGLPDLSEKLKDGEIMGEIPAEINERFIRDFVKICRKTFMEFRQKIFQVFTPSEEALKNEKIMGKWKGENKRRICDKYCRKPKAPPPRQKAEL